MARIAVVHGINNTYRDSVSMAAQWVPALLGGIRLSDRRVNVSADDVSCAFYGDVFRPAGRFLGGNDLTTLDGTDIQDLAELALVDQWWAYAAANDPAVMPPGTRTIGAGGAVKAALAALAGSRFVAGASERLLILWLKQVRDYFTDPETRRAIQARFAEVVAGDTKVVVAHSLGSVVAYEALCAHPDWGVETLVTLGSPLGIRNIIFDRLTPRPNFQYGELRGAWPGAVGRWTNVSDRFDFVALVPRLHRCFGGELVDVQITNGTSLHDVTRYLTAKETGAAIADGLVVARSGWPKDRHG